jgi:hypothetical protein
MGFSCKFPLIVAGWDSVNVLVVYRQLGHASVLELA